MLEEKQLPCPSEFALPHRELAFSYSSNLFFIPILQISMRKLLPKYKKDPLHGLH